jgi:hypothetical protein
MSLDVELDYAIHGPPSRWVPSNTPRGSHERSLYVRLSDTHTLAEEEAFELIVQAAIYQVEHMNDQPDYAPIGRGTFHMEWEPLPDGTIVKWPVLDD